MNAIDLGLTQFTRFETDDVIVNEYFNLYTTENENNGGYTRCRAMGTDFFFLISFQRNVNSNQC